MSISFACHCNRPRRTGGPDEEEMPQLRRGPYWTLVWSPPGQASPAAVRPCLCGTGAAAPRRRRGLVRHLCERRLRGKGSFSAGKRTGLRGPPKNNSRGLIADCPMPAGGSFCRATATLREDCCQAAGVRQSGIPAKHPPAGDPCFGGCGAGGFRRSGGRVRRRDISATRSALGSRATTGATARSACSPPGAR
jgi:hypothetical protein